MNIQKNIFYAIGGTLLLTACSLDREPETAISGAGVIIDESTAETVLVGSYDATQSFVGSQIVAFNSASDNVIGFGSAGASVPLLTASGSGGGYNQYYSAINQVNQLIADIPGLNDVLFTGNSKNTKLAEAYFLRALAYFGLARTYGGVPLVFTPSSSGHSADGIKRSSYAETLALVESDLNQAEALFDKSLPTRARASIWAVYALKARLYLYQERWDKAEEYATKVLENTSFALTTEVRDWYEKALSTDAIFELVFTTADKNPIYTYYLPASLGGRIDYAPSREVIQLLLDEKVSGKRKQLLAQMSDNSEQYVVQQYNKTDGTSSFPVLRLEEQYLIRAEARVQQGKLTTAVEDINVLRKRAGVELLSAGGKSSKDLLLVLELERRLELAFDGHRYNDIIRTGRAAEVFGEINEVYKDSRYWVFPIPWTAIAADSDLEQNPGY